MRVENLFKRLKREYIKVKLLESSLDALILVLSLNFAAFLASYSYDARFLAGIGLTVFIIDFYYRSRDYSVEVFEHENERLREVLRTAKDNLDRRDEVTEALFDDVMHRARKVSSESIIPSERVFQKLFLVGGLAILTSVSGLVAPAVDFDFDNAYDRISEFSEDDDNQDFRKNSSRVLGEPEDIETRGSNININISGSGESFESGTRAGFESEELRFEASNNEIDRDLDLAKRYSLAIRD